MKRLKSEAGCGDDDEEKLEQLKNKSSLITDFTNKLWNLTPNINFSEDAEVETFLPAPKKVITPTKSFDNLVNLGLSEPETVAADQPDLEGEEPDVVVEEEVVVNYNAEASYRVQVNNMRNLQAEQPGSTEQQTVEPAVTLDTNFMVSHVTPEQETEKPDSEEQVETVLDLEREKERVDDEAAEELVVMKKDAVSAEKCVQSENVLSEKMEARAKENDKAGAGMKRNGKNRGSNKGKKRKEKV